MKRVSRANWRRPNLEALQKMDGFWNWDTDFEMTPPDYNSLNFEAVNVGDLVFNYEKFLKNFATKFTDFQTLYGQK